MQCLFPHHTGKDKRRIIDSTMKETQIIAIPMKYRNAVPENLFTLLQGFRPCPIKHGKT